MKKIYLLFVLFVATCLSSQAQVYLTASGGTSPSTYSTLGAAFTAINAGTHTGTIDIRINANTTEATTATLTNAGSYSSILIRPDDSSTVEKVISGSINGSAIISLTTNASNVTFDGRVGGTGTTSMLKISNTNVNTNSHTINLSAVSNCNFVWCTITNGTSINQAYVVSVGNTGTTAINFSNNVITGGFASFLFNGTTMSNLTLSKNSISDFYALGLWVNGGVSSITIDSNSIFHSSGYSSAANNTIRGIYIPQALASSTINITRNTIYDLNSTFSGVAPNGNIIYGIQVTPGSNVVSQTVNIRNNMISLTKTNQYSTGMYGIAYNGAGSSVVSIDYNTLKIGGALNTSYGAANNVLTRGIWKSNTATTNSTFNCRNNIVRVERTGGVQSGGFDNAWHLAAWYHSNGSLVGTNNINRNIYSSTALKGGTQFYTAYIGSVYTTYTGSYAVNANPQEQNSNFYNSLNFVGNVDLHLTGASIKDPELIGTPIGGVTIDMDNETRDASFPYKGADETTAFNTNDATVVTVYTMGKIPSSAGNPHLISASIKNVGVAAKSSFKVYLNVTGANSFQDSVTIASLAVNASVNVDFNVAGYTNIGTNTVTVSVESDQNTSNDSRVATLKTTANAYNYGDFALPPSGGVGFTGATGDFIAKFKLGAGTYNDSAIVNQISVFFNTGNDSVQIGVWAMDTVTKRPGANLWSSATFKAVTGPALQVIDVPNIAVKHAFYCGVRQIKTTNIGFAYQTETPIRDSSFYFASPTGSTSWNDFAPNNPFKFMIEPRLQLKDDIGGTELVAPSNNCVDGPNQTVTFRFKNLGWDTIDYATDPVTIKSNCIIPGNTTTNFSDVVINTGTLLPGATQDVTVSTTFNMTASGNYKFRAWSSCGIDINAENDTVPQVTIAVVASKAIPLFEDFNAGISTPTDWTLSGGFAVTAAVGSSASNGLRINNWTGNLSGTVSIPKVATATATTAIQFEYKMTNFTGGGATTLTVQDSLLVQVSSDCGATFTTVASINSGNHTPSTNFATQLISLSAYNGQKIIVRLISKTTGATSNDYNVDIDNINIFNQANMAYVSSNVVQTNFTSVAVNSTDNELLALRVVTSGNLSPLSVSSLTFRTTGLTNVADLTNIKVYYTGNNSTFSTSNLVATITGPVAGLNTFTFAPVSLTTGNNYFWFGFTTTASATVGNKVDGRVDNVVVNGVSKVPGINTVAGDRMIFYCTPVHSTTCGTNFINSIKMGTINNLNTGCANTNGNSWSNYFTSNSPSVTTNLRANNTYRFVFTNDQVAQIAAMWIDYNRNGVYEASEYTLLGSNVQGNDSVVLNITIPSNVTPGVAGMRIRTRTVGGANTSTDACTSFNNGETEDYKVVLQAPCDWTGAISTSWLNPANWASNSVPTGTDNVKILVGTFDPTINTTASVNNLDINVGATINFGTAQNLTINGTLTRSGTLNASTGRIFFTKPQSIPAQDYFYLSLSGNTGNYSLAGNIVVNNFLMVNSTTTLDLNGFTCENKRDITNNGSIIGLGKSVFTTTLNAQTISGNGIFSNVEVNTGAANGVRLYNSCSITDTLWLTQGYLTLNPAVTLTSGSVSTNVGNIITTGGNITGSNSANSAHVIINGNAGASQITNFKMAFPGSLTMNRPNGIILGANMSISGTTTLTNGTLEMNGFNFTSGTTGLSSGNITGAGNIKNSGATGTLSILGNSSATAITALKLDTMQNLTLNRQAGLSIANGFFVKGNVFLNSGDINLNGQVVTLGSSANLSENAGNTFKGTSGSVTTTRTFGSALSNNNVAGLGLKLSTNAAPGVTTITRAHNSYTSMSGNSINRNFDVTVASNVTATVFEMNYDSSELAGADRSKLRINQSTNSGATWSDIVGCSPSTANAATGKVSKNGVSLSGSILFTASDSANTPLTPVFVNNTQNNAAVVNSVNQFMVYPNPFNNEFTLDMTVVAGNYSIILTDINGKVIINQNIEAVEGNSKMVLSTSELAQGVYLLNLVSNNGRQTLKVVKQ